MSPEQARGKRVDKRTDIWAFGCVLYEMLTGRRAFAGETVSDTIAAILERDPDWSVLPETTPPTIRRLLQRCLEKDPKRRLRDIGDGQLRARRADRLRRDRPRSSLGFRALRCGRQSGLHRRRPDGGPRSAFRATCRNQRGDPLLRCRLATSQIAFSMALSPDGRVLVYGGGDSYTSHLYRRTLDTLESVPIRGTEGGRHPFFSPDGATIGFFGRPGLKRIPLEGGVATTVLASIPPRGGAGAVWLSDDTIVFASLSQGLMRVGCLRRRGQAAHHDRPRARRGRTSLAGRRAG